MGVGVGVSGGGERTALVYVTVCGSVGVLCPLGSRREREVLCGLEAALIKNLAGGVGGKGKKGKKGKRKEKEGKRKGEEGEEGEGGEGEEEEEQGGLDPVLFPTGRDPLTYRSSVRPAKGVIDLDLIAAAGRVKRAQAARDAKIDPVEAEAVVTEALAAMCLSRSG